MQSVLNGDMQVPQRYNFAEQQWQSFAKAGMTGDYNFNSGAAVFNSKVFVLYEKGRLGS